MNIIRRNAQFHTTLAVYFGWMLMGPCRKAEEMVLIIAPFSTSCWKINAQFKAVLN